MRGGSTHMLMNDKGLGKVEFIGENFSIDSN
jgi:hypothetical protein